MAEKKEYQIKVQGQLVSVTEEVYLTYYRMKRRELHLEEKDAKHGVFHYSALDTAEINGEDAIPDLTSPRVEDVVTDKLIAEKFHQCLAQLDKEVNLGGSIDIVHNPVTLVEIAVEKGATSILMPVSCRRQLFDLSDEMATKIDIQFYLDSRDALIKSIIE